MSHEPLRGLAWILATLRGDTAFAAATPGGVWLGAAPQTANATPYGVVNLQSGVDVAGVAGQRIWVDALYQVVSYAPNDALAALTASADAADAALQLASGTAQGGTVLVCVREQPLIISEWVVGSNETVLWTRVGGMYRLYVQ